MHKNNLIHGDIKEDNFLIDNDNIILCDFWSSSKIEMQNMSYNVTNLNPLSATDDYISEDLKNLI